MAGAPPGNDNAAKGKKWRAAIDRALAERSRVDGKELLDQLAGVLINQALAGEQWAIKELGDRLDGKAAQSLAVGGGESPVRLAVGWMKSE